MKKPKDISSIILANKHKIRLLFLIFLGFFTILSLSFGVTPAFVLALTTWIGIFIYACFDLSKRIMLATFLVSFFVFLLGGHTVYEYFDMKIHYFISDEIYIHSNILISLSLIFIFVLYYLIERLKESRKRNLQTAQRNNLIKGISSMLEKYDIAFKKQEIRKISKTCFLLTYWFWIIEPIEKGIFVFRNSYHQYYVDYKSIFPFFVRAIGAMSPYFFFIFLATMPSNKKARYPIILFFLYSVLSLATGRRIDFVLMLMFIAIYFLIRQYRNQSQENWITRKMLIAFLGIMPILIIILYSFNYIRSNQASSSGITESKILGFFYQQGFSSSVIRLTEHHSTELSANAYYSFFGLLKWLRTNSVIKLFYQFPYNFSYIGNSIDFATKGNSLANSLSYIVLSGDRYLRGSSVGSCYIAELFHDFKYLGVIIGSSIYGSMIALIDNEFSRKIVRVFPLAFCFSLVESFLKTPRWNFDIVFTAMLDLAMWSAIVTTIILVTMISFFPKSRKQKEE